jgi:hypothetical protein
MRTCWALLFAAFGVAAHAAAAPAAVTFRPYRRPITTWVPPYAVAASRARLAETFGEVPAGEGLTHLGLQFWVPTPEGVVARVKSRQVTDAAITELREWGHARGIRVMLCVYNGAVKWDWPLAKAAFADHRTEFVRSLVAETERLGLDGVDVDLEGPGSFDADKPAYLAFMRELSGELRARKMHLTVDTFAYKWNAPNQTWWAELFPLVDAVASMGYDETGATAPDWRSYADQKKAAGPHAARLQLGMPSDKDRWRGNTNLEHLQWVGRDPEVGVAIWDAQLPSPEWRTPEVWRTLREIRGTDAAQ